MHRNNQLTMFTFNNSFITEEVKPLWRCSYLAIKQMSLIISKLKTFSMRDNWIGHYCLKTFIKRRYYVQTTQLKRNKILLLLNLRTLNINAKIIRFRFFLFVYFVIFFFNFYIRESPI